MHTTARRAAHRGGFSLLELVLVIVVLGLLAAIAIPTYNRIFADTTDTTAEANIEAALRAAVANSVLEGHPYPTIEDVQVAFNETVASSTAPGVTAAGTYTVCESNNPSCLANASNTGTAVAYSADDGDNIVGIVVYDDPRVLGNISGNTAKAWVRQGGTIADALAGVTGAVDGGGDESLDTNHPTYQEIAVSGEGVFVPLHGSVNVATVDVTTPNGLALIAVGLVDSEGNPLEFGSPNGCADITRTVISGNGNLTNCPGDPGYNEAVTGSPWGIACIDTCRIQFSSEQDFTVAAFRIPSDWGGADYNVKTVATPAP